MASSGGAGSTTNPEIARLIAARQEELERLQNDPVHVAKSGLVVGCCCGAACTGGRGRRGINNAMGMPQRLDAKTSKGVNLGLSGFAGATGALLGDRLHRLAKLPGPRSTTSAGVASALATTTSFVLQRTRFDRKLCDAGLDVSPLIRTLREVTHPTIHQSK